MTVLSDQDNSVISGNGGSGNSQSRWVGKMHLFPILLHIK